MKENCLNGFAQYSQIQIHSDEVLNKLFKRKRNIDVLL